MSDSCQYCNMPNGTHDPRCPELNDNEQNSLAAMPGSVSRVVVNQDLVNEIVRRAKASQMGLGDQENSTDLNNYEPPHTTETLALLLVSAWSAKYDLVSVFAAAMDAIEEKTPNVSS